MGLSRWKFVKRSLGGLLESGEARLGRGGFFTGGIETDHIFVQLLRVGPVHLALFELGGLEDL